MCIRDSDCGATDSFAMQQGAIITATSIQLSGGTTEPGLVNTGAVEMVFCFAYLRWALQSRGYTPELAAGFQSIDKQKADGKPGGDHHRAHWRRFWCYTSGKQLALAAGLLSTMWLSAIVRGS